MITGAEGVGNREVGRGLSDGFAAVCPPARIRLAGGGRGLRARRGNLRAERQEQEEHEPVGQDNEKTGTRPPPAPPRGRSHPGRRRARVASSPWPPSPPHLGSRCLRRRTPSSPPASPPGTGPPRRANP